MKVTRVIHPIGQGAFYSERIECDDRTYNIIYDCGSGNGKKASKLLEREIASYYKKNDVIDVLFISHFDNDHINGINELKRYTSKIKNIIVPLIEQGDFWFYGIENDEFERFYNSLTELANSVYKIKPASEENYNLNFPELIDLSESEEGSFEVQNATKFSLRRSVDWCYIPFNYDKKIRLNILKNELVNYGISEKELNSGWEAIEHHIDYIKKAYKKVVADGANKTSLILYSGGVEGEYDCWQYQGCMCYSPWLYHRSFYRYNKEGCLYFGDNDLNQANILNDLKHKLSSLVERVGTIQAPHHGAINNFNDDIFAINNSVKMFFVSFGNKNIYGHPSSRVVSEILMNGDVLLEITEQRGSAYVQIIKGLCRKPKRICRVGSEQPLSPTL